MSSKNNSSKNNSSKNNSSNDNDFNIRNYNSGPNNSSNNSSNNERDHKATARTYPNSSNSNSNSNNNSNQHTNKRPSVKKVEVNFGSLSLENNEEKYAASSAASEAEIAAFVKKGDQQLDALSQASNQLLKWWMAYTTGKYMKQYLRLHAYASNHAALTHHRIRALQQEAKRLREELIRAWSYTTKDKHEYDAIFEGMMQYIGEGTLSETHAAAITSLLATIQLIPISQLESKASELVHGIDAVIAYLRQRAGTAHENRNNTQRIGSKWNDPTPSPMIPEHRLPATPKQRFLTRSNRRIPAPPSTAQANANARLRRKIEQTRALRQHPK